YELQHHTITFALRSACEQCGQRARTTTRAACARSWHPYEAAEHTRQLLAPSAPAKRAHVQARQHWRRLGAGQGEVEQPETLLARVAEDPRARDPAQIRLAELSGHAGRLLPRAPSHRKRGQPKRTAMGRQGVEERVGSGI